MKKKITLGTVINLIYPLIFGFLFCFLFNRLNFTFQTEGYDSVLESIINFSSIIIGFYTAMYGIMIGLFDSDLFKIFRKNKVQNYFKYQLYDSLVVSFLILLLSIAMQVLMNITDISSIRYVTLIFKMWTFILGYFVGTSFRSITLLLKIMFHHNKPNKMNKKEERKKEKRLKNLTRD